MKYLEVAAPMDKAKDLMEYLQNRSVMEIKQLDETEGLTTFETAQLVVTITKFRDTAQTALKILGKYAPVKTSMLAGLVGPPEISKSEYDKRAEKVDGLLSVCREICSSEKTIGDNAAAVSRYRAGMDALEPWLTLDLSMKYAGTTTTDAFIGTLPADYTADSLEIALSPYLEGKDKFECEVVSHARDRSCIFVVCHKECSAEMLSALRTMGFAYPADPTKHPPKVRYERLQKQIDDANALSEQLKEKIKGYASLKEDIGFVYDWFAIKCAKYEALDKVSAGNAVVAFGGYVPVGETQTLVDEIENNFSAAAFVRDPTDDEDVPVLLHNRPFAAAVEPITEMYSLPGKADIDPNPVMCFFYYMLFGIMLSDAGYGLIMAVACGIAKFKYKVKGKMKKTVDMYWWCGLATVFWGALFGSWFGDFIPRIATEFFHKTIDISGVIPWAQPNSIALWFEPVNDPMKLMLYSFLFGIIHLFFGLGCSFVKMWKAGNKVGAICDCIPVYLLILGIAPLGAGIIIDVPQTITDIAKYLALAGAVLIVLTAGRSSKNIVAKLGLGLYGLYNTASGWLSDILSYSRLLALGLCTGVIATVVNTLGCIPQNPVVKAILMFVVFIVGHTVNMAINLIGTYVHTNRLQYVEFFSKFYEGGGRAFTPLKATTKYYQVKED